MGTLYKRHRRKADPATGRTAVLKTFVYYADYVDQNGERCQVSLGTSFADVARSKLRDLEASVVRGKRINKRAQALRGKLDQHEAELMAELHDMRKRKGDEYVRALEARYVTMSMQWQIATDEISRLRHDIAILNRSANRAG